MRNESCVILTKEMSNAGIDNICRLIRTVCPTTEDDIYSVFLTTVCENETDEEFVYDIARKKSNALILFDRICSGGVTACTLHDAAHDFTAELLLAD